MRFGHFLPALILSLVLPMAASASSNPIPGVGIVVKRNPGSSTARSLSLPAGFFGAGSAAFSGVVAMQGRHSHDCGGCNFDCTVSSCGDSRIDYSFDFLTGPFDASMAAMTLYSSAPISVSIGGTVSLVEVIVTLSGPALVSDDPIPGAVVLAPGGVLDLGASAQVQSSRFDLHCTVTFADAATGQAMGSALEQDLSLTLNEPLLPIKRVASGTPAGEVVLGLGTAGAAPFTYSSAGGELVIAMSSTFSQPPVPTTVRASGLSCTSTGGASVSTSPDGRSLVVSNLGRTGEDGVSIELPRTSGHRMASSSSWTNADVGAVCSWSWGASNTGSSGLSHGRVVLQRIPNGQRLSVDLSELSSSPTMACALYRDGLLVSSFTCPSTSSLDFTSTLSSPMPLPDVGLDFMSVAGSKRTCLFNLGLKGRMMLTPPGSSTPVECDLIVGTEQCDNGDGSTLDRCNLLVTCPDGVTMSSLQFVSQSFVKFGVSLTVVGEDCDDVAASLHLSHNPAYVSSGLAGEMPIRNRVYVDGGSSTPRNVLLSSFLATSLVCDKSGPLLFKRGQDEGSSIACRVLGTNSCSPTGVVASLSSLFSASGSLDLTADFSGMCPSDDSVYLSRGGLLVAAFALPPSHTISITPPPGGPLGMAINEKGLPGGKTPKQTTTNNPKGPQGVGVPGGGSDLSVVGPEGLSLHVSFADPRVVCLDGTCVTFDDVTFHATPSSSAPVITLTGQNFSFGSCSSGTCSSSSNSFSISNFSRSSVDQIRAVIPPSVSISSRTPVVVVPVVIDRASATAARGASVTFKLDPSLVLVAPVVEYDYFSSFGASQQFVVDNGGRSYTVDCALLGPGCGPTSSGTLFAISVARAPGAPDGVASITIEDVELADCAGATIPCSAGGVAQIVLDGSSPTAITDLSATQCKTGNDADGTTCISLIWSPRTNVDETVEVYRASYGNYPLFSRGGTPGSVPSPPASCPPSGRFSPVSSSLVTRCDVATGACTVVDEPSSRDEFYYVAVVRDRAGNYSSCSNLTNGTLDFHLGDVADGGGGGGGGATLARCPADNLVNSADISRLGSVYGSTFSTTSSSVCADFGPTDDGSVIGRPVPDGRLNFKDLILYAINYSVVSIPRSAPAPAAAASNALTVRLPSLPEVGNTFDAVIALDGAGDLQGLSAQLAWDAAVVEPLAVSEGDLIAQQSRTGVVLSAAPGNIDAALLGVGGGISGSGTLARVTFRVKAAGDAAIRLARVEGRDARNQPVALAGVGGVTPGRTAIRMAFPNPFDQHTTVVLALSQAGPVEVGVYDVTGRQVRTLVRGTQAAGERIVSWDGRDDRGARVGAGVYLLRLQAGGHSETRALRLVR